VLRYGELSVNFVPGHSPELRIYDDGAAEPRETVDLTTVGNDADAIRSLLAEKGFEASPDDSGAAEGGEATPAKDEV